MNLQEQRKLLGLWCDYICTEGAVKPASNAQLVGFYLDVVKDSDLYAYGVAFEVFDVLTNGIFDPAATAKTAMCRTAANKSRWIEAA